mmetsp:Transcript_7765/g.8978  ORF Transcript_7765/g.8978 Transcript_7765/m.8978 type:complete len:357 (-) Transcript_7765:51-1121(-)
MVNLIKGYLPVQITFPSLFGKESDNTFIFVKQHVSAGDDSPRTLFVTNAPIYPHIRTSIFLRSLFERYGDVEKVAVAKRPSKNLSDEAEEEGGGNLTVEELTLSMFEKEVRSLQSDGLCAHMSLEEDEWYDQGRYAHVIFANSKEMKKFLNAFTSKKKKKKSSASDNIHIIKYGKLEIQELQDISRSLFNKERNKFLRRESSDEPEERPQGMMVLIQAHKDRIPPRAALTEACEQIMAKYEESEEEARQRQIAAKDQPDEDGFVTVSYSTNVGDAKEFEENGTLTIGSGAKKPGRRERNNTNAKKKVVKGSDQLKDFYRFQLKETKKRTMQQLKNRFEEDLKRVKKMKEDKMYKPF